MRSLDRSTTIAVAVCVLGAAAVWFGCSFVTGEREAWDATLFWTVGYPLQCVVAGVAGWLAPRKPWRWGMLAMNTNLLVLLLTVGPSPFLVIGIVFLAWLAMPATGVAYLGARLRGSAPA